MVPQQAPPIFLFLADLAHLIGCLSQQSWEEPNHPAYGLFFLAIVHHLHSQDSSSNFPADHHHFHHIKQIYPTVVTRVRDRGDGYESGKTPLKCKEAYMENITPWHTHTRVCKHIPLENMLMFSEGLLAWVLEHKVQFGAVLCLTLISKIACGFES